MFSIKNIFSVIQKFDAVFGANTGIPATNDMPWNSVLRQVISILEKGMAPLISVSRDADRHEYIFSTKEWDQLTRLHKILEPFKVETDNLQGDKEFS